MRKLRCGDTDLKWNGRFWSCLCIIEELHPFFPEEDLPRRALLAGIKECGAVGSGRET